MPRSAFPTRGASQSRRTSTGRAVPRVQGNSRSTTGGDMIGLMPEKEQYMAVVNPTGDVVQTWGRGRRAVLVPGELGDAKRACVQVWRRPIALQMVKNKRKFLVSMPYEVAQRLVQRARDLGNFFEAWNELAGRGLPRAAEVVRRLKVERALDRQLASIGIEPFMTKGWSLDRKRAVMRNPELAFDSGDMQNSGIPGVYTAGSYKEPDVRLSSATAVSAIDGDAMELLPQRSAGEPRPLAPDTRSDFYTQEDDAPAEAEDDSMDASLLNEEEEDIAPEPKQYTPEQLAGIARLTAAQERRSAITKELKRRGIKYHGRASTETLERQLAEANAFPAAAAGQ
jgi:hypothetical protein